MRDKAIDPATNCQHLTVHHFINAAGVRLRNLVLLVTSAAYH
jgi:hypothetical protein